MRDGDRDGVHHADQIDIGRVDETHRVGVAHRHRQDARVGHHDIDSAEFGAARLQHLTEFVTLADIGDPRHHATADLFDRTLRVGEVIWGRQRVWVGGDVATDVDPDDVGALSGHRDGVRTALAAGHPGDERNLAFEFSGHVTSTSGVRLGSRMRSLALNLGHKSSADQQNETNIRLLQVPAMPWELGVTPPSGHRRADKEN